MAKKAELSQDVQSFDAKKMLLENAEKGTKIRYTDRTKVRLLKPTKNMKAGTEYSPAKVKAEALVLQGIAEYIKD